MTLTYQLAGGGALWPPDKLAMVSEAMDAALQYYNSAGNTPDRTLTVHYVPDLPTADANANGTIRFGGSCSCRVALHEVAHALGVGTHHDWPALICGGKWLGRCGLAALAELDGPGAELHADVLHFWPYGLNYDREWSSEEDGRRHVRMVMALLQDLEAHSQEAAQYEVSELPLELPWRGPQPVAVHRFRKGDKVFYCHCQWWGFASMEAWGWRVAGVAFHAWPKEAAPGTVEVHLFRKGEMVFLCHGGWADYGRMAGWGWARDEHCPVAFYAFAPGTVPESVLDVWELRRGELACYVRSDMAPELGFLEERGWARSRVAFCVPA